MGPDEPHNTGQKHHFYAEMKALEDFLETRVSLPLVAQFHAYVSERVAPRPRADKRIDVEAQQVHLRDARRQRDEGADDGKHASDEHRDRTILHEEVFGTVEVALAEQDVAAIALHHRTTTLGADPVRGDRAEIRGQRGDRCEDDELQLRVRESVAGERHDDFRRDRNAGRLDCHEQRDGNVPSAGDEADKKSDEFLRHWASVYRAEMKKRRHASKENASGTQRSRRFGENFATLALIACPFSYSC